VPIWGSVFAGARKPIARVKLPCAWLSERSASTSCASCFAEAILVSLGGAVCGMAGAVVILRVLSTWRAYPRHAHQCARESGCEDPMPWHCCLALVSGFLFGLVPVRQVLAAPDPWQIIRSGSSAAGRWRRFTLRDALLAMQIAICAVLITASPGGGGAAWRVRSRAAMVSIPGGRCWSRLICTWAVYDGDERAVMQRRMIDAAAAIPGRHRCRLQRPAAA